MNEKNKGKSYILQNMDDKFWRQVKAAAALRDLTIQNYLLSFAEKDLKVKPILNKRMKK